MNLIIDQGNTSVKLAVFSNNELIERLAVSDLNIVTIKKMLKSFPEIDKSIISSVSEYSEEIPKFLAAKISQLVVLSSETPIPLVNNYKSKETLGPDRIAASVGAYTIYPLNNVLIIDAGTAITFDFLTSKGEFMGGNISPGIDLRLKALNVFTKKLPLVEKKRTFGLLGKTTHDAILSGVINGVIFEVDGYISELKELYSGLKVILTGGDINFFVKKLKNVIFVDANLVLTGLNRILEYNGK